MSYRPTQAFFSPDDWQLSQRCRCALHSTPERDVWVSTSWTKLNPDTPAEVFEVTATATNKLFCRDHLGQEETKVITRQAYSAAPSNVKWDFFEP